MTVRSQQEPVLSVKGLTVEYTTERGDLRAVDRVSFDLYDGQRFGLVGESGSGKTTTALALMRLTQSPGRIVAGQVILQGTDLLSLSEDDMREVRLAQISYVPQGAMNSLNPVMKVGNQIANGFKDHINRISGSEIADRTAGLLSGVGLDPGVARMYPHELSGGMKQRVAIAIAVSLSPKVIIADEPTSALDVVVQREVMLTLRRLQEELGAAVLIVGHDMGLMAQFATDIGVMYAGEVVEIGPVMDMFDAPLHPYTRALIGSLPSAERRSRLVGIPGLPPALLELPTGCSFNPRCRDVMDECLRVDPRLAQVRTGRWASCHLYAEEAVSPTS